MTGVVEIPQIGEKRCSLCKTVKPATVEYFYRNAKSRDGLAPYCRECHLELNKANYRKAKALRGEVRARLALIQEAA